jgi:L-asparaginase II
VQRRLRAVMTDLCGTNADDFAYGTDGCGIPTLATPLGCWRARWPSMADPSRLVEQARRGAARIRAAMNAEPFMMAGTGRFCTRINERAAGRGAGQDRRRGRVLRHAAGLGLGIALKMWDGRGARAEVAMATCSAISACCRPTRREELLHPPVKNVVGLLVGEMRPAKSWLG